MSKRIVFSFLIVLVLAIGGCSKKVDMSDPAEVVKSFILLCEAGKVDEAKTLLTEKHNLDYMDKFENKNKGKDLFYIDYDYKGNDDTVELKFENLKDKSGPTIAFVKLTSNYKKQNHEFEKVVTLHMVNSEWKINDFLFMPVKVK